MEASTHRKSRINHLNYAERISAAPINENQKRREIPPPPERADRRKSSPELPMPPAQTQKPPHLSQKIKRRTKLTKRGTAGARATEGANVETRLEETYPPSILAGDDAVAATAAGEAKRKP